VVRVLQEPVVELGEPFTFVNLTGLPL